MIRRYELSQSQWERIAYVQTELTGQHQMSDPRAMPLDAYITEVTRRILPRCKSG